MSVLKAVYEILVPVERKMELRQAVIQSGIIASVGKYTMPWIIDRAVSVLLLTNLRAPQKGHVILKNISANLLIPRILFRVSLSPVFFISYSFFIMINDQRFNDNNSNGVLKKKKKKGEKTMRLSCLLFCKCNAFWKDFTPFVSKMLPCLSCLKNLVLNQSQLICLGSESP